VTVFCHPFPGYQFGDRNFRRYWEQLKNSVYLLIKKVINETAVVHNFEEFFQDLQKYDLTYEKI